MNESEDERNDFKKAVKGRCIIPTTWLTFSFFPVCTSAIHTKSRFQEATDMSLVNQYKLGSGENNQCVSV